jgi:hypothetical protein
MANYKLTPSVSDYINRETNRLMNLHTDCIEQDFPVTRSELHDALVPPEAREPLRKLISLGISSVSTGTELYAVIEGEGIEVPVYVCIGVNGAGVPYFHGLQATARYYVSNKRNFPEEKQRPQLSFYLDALSLDHREKMTKWINRSVFEHRRANAVRALVKEFVHNHCETLAHLDARWPDLKLLFAGQNFKHTVWADRIRNLPTRIQTKWKWPEFGPHRDWYNDNQQRMQAAAQMIVGATLLDRATEKVAAPEVTANVRGWLLPTQP